MEIKDYDLLNIMKVIRRLVMEMPAFIQYKAFPDVDMENLISTYAKMLNVARETEDLRDISFVEEDYKKILSSPNAALLQVKGE